MASFDSSLEISLTSSINTLDNTKISTDATQENEKSLLANSTVDRIICLYLRHNLSLVCLEDVMDLMNENREKCDQFPTNKKQILQKFREGRDLIEIIFFVKCKKCGEIVKINSENVEKVKCCDEIVKKTETNFFVYMPLKKQISKSIEKNWSYIQSFDTTNKNDGSYSDAHDGEILRDVLKQYEDDDLNILSLCLNVDGANRFNSNTVSLWPIQFTQNYLPPEIRFLPNNIIVGGLMYTEGKFDFRKYLLPLVEELAELKEHNIELNIEGQEYAFKPVITHCIVDLPAKSKIQETKQYGGYDACTYCEIPGELVTIKNSNDNKKGKKSNKNNRKQNIKNSQKGKERKPLQGVRYVEGDHSYPLRDEKETLKKMLLASSSSDDVDGIKVLNHNFQQEPQNLSLPAGQMAVFHCSAPRGAPPPRIYWKKDDQIVRAGFGRVQQLANGSIIVNEVRKTDEGRFVCVAENMLGIRESASATLTVYVKPNFVQSPEDITAKIGDRVRFQCVVDGDPRPTLHWRKENGQLPGNRVEIDPQDNSMIINNVDLSDDGFYICEAANLIGNNSAAASLVVHIVPSDITASLNGVAKLPCAVTGNPPPNLFWTKEGNQELLFPGNSNGRFTVTPSGHLTITDLQAEDTGFYVCSAVSVVGSAMAKAHIKVTSAFEGPPPIIRFGPANQTLPTETIALLFCEVIQPIGANDESLMNGQSVSRVKVSWLKNGHPIASDRRFIQLESNTLQINNLQINDTGTYTCVASYTDDGNRLGQSKSELPTTNWSAMLQVESPRNPNIAFHRQSEFSSYPSAPFKPVIINFTNTEITVSWRKVQEIGSSPLTGYRLEYYDADSPKPTWQLASNRIFTEIFTVKHLQPNTRYVFLVRAENSHGLSAPSPLSNVVQTLKFTPNRLNPSSSNSNHHHSNQKDLDDIRSHLNAIQVILKEAKPMSANSVKLIWELVHRDQNMVNKENIEGYYIRFRDVGPDLDELQNDLKLLNRPSAAKMSNAEHQKYNMLTVLTSGSNVNSYVISDLSEFTLYELFLVPFYKSVDGPPSNSKLVRTLADLPSAPPADVKAHLLNLTAITVHWKPVPKPQRNGIIQAYNVMLIPIQLANSTMVNNPNLFSMDNSGLHVAHYLDRIQQYNPSSSNMQQASSSAALFNTGNMHIGQPSLYSGLPHSSSIFPPPMDFQDNNDLSSAALLSRNAPLFNANLNSHNLHPNEPVLHSAPPNFQQQILLNALSRNITTNANTHQLTIGGLQPGAIYQLRIAAANMIGYGPASVPLHLQMTAEYIIEGADREDLNSDQNPLDGSTNILPPGSFNRNLFNSKIITIVFTVSLTGLLIGAVCFVVNRRTQNLNKYDKTNSTNKTKFSFTSSSNATTKNNKLANDLFSNTNHPMITASGDLTSPSDALWIDRNWLAATQNSQTADYPLLKNDPTSTMLTGLNSRTDHRSTSSAIYASTSLLNCSRPSINNPSNGEYCALQSQNDYAEVSELAGAFHANKHDTLSSNLSGNNKHHGTMGYALNNIGGSKVSNNNNVLMSSNAYATTTLINLNQNGGRVALQDNSIKEQVCGEYPNYGDNDFQGSMLYEHNSSIEPTSSTLLLQRTPSESGSYTTDEYSYRRNNNGSKQQLKNQTTIERNKKKSKKSNCNNNNGTLCSKSSTASSHISEHSKVSIVQQQQQQLPNKSNMFLVNEPSSVGNLVTMRPPPPPNQDQDSPPSPAPNHPSFSAFTGHNSSQQRIFTTNQQPLPPSQPNQNYNVYESAYDANLYGGINRVQLGNRQHHTLNTRQLNNQQQRKNQAQRPQHNRVLDFIELNSDLNGSNNHTMNLISNPLHHNSQGSLPSLVNADGQQQSNGQANSQQTSMMKKMLINNNGKQLNSRHQLRVDSNMKMNSSLNRSSSSLVSESDNFYCDIDEAERVQSEFRAKMNANKQRYEQQNYESGDENGEDLASENDKLISKNENKLIVQHRRLQEDEDEDLLTDQYSDYECIDVTRPQPAANRFASLAANNPYLRQQPSHQMNKTSYNANFTTASYNQQQRLTPVNLMASNNNPSASSLNDAKLRQPFNLSLARKNQLNNQPFSNSQPGLFRFKENNNGSFNTMQTNNRMR